MRLAPIMDYLDKAEDPPPPHCGLSLHSLPSSTRNHHQDKGGVRLHGLACLLPNALRQCYKVTCVRALLRLQLTRVWLRYGSEGGTMWPVSPLAHVWPPTCTILKDIEILARRVSFVSTRHSSRGYAHYMPSLTKKTKNKKSHQLPLPGEHRYLHNTKESLWQR